MIDESRSEVGQAVRTMAQDVHVEPSTELLAGVGRKATKIRRTRRAKAALAAAGCLVAVSVILGLVVVPGGRAQRVATVAPPTTSSAGSVAPPATSSAGSPATGSGRGPSTGSRTITYEGVQIVVPITWPVLPGSKAPFCGSETWPTVATVYVGSQEHSVGCPYVHLSGQLDGVALQAGNGPVTGTVTVVLPSGQRVHQTPPVSEGPGTTLWFHGVWVQIGPDTTAGAARSVLASLAYQPAARDTAVVGACPTVAASAVMPMPQRLDHRLVLDRGDYVLDPPQATNQASVPASVIWDAAKPTPGSQTADSEQLLLTLLSAKYPAVLQPNGSVLPVDHNLLAWVVYSTPLNTSVPDCGGWGLDVFSARTGAPLTSSGWTPGP